MGTVTMTVFFTHCCRNRRNESRMTRWLLLWSFVLVLWAGVTPLPEAQAADAAEAAELRLERAEDGLYLSTNPQITLPDLAESALYKGIPMYFVAEAQVMRDRWYWSDRQVAETTRYLRLSYQPLTRRWRLNMSSTPFTNSGLGVVLGQTFDDYTDAMSAVQRFSRWKIAESDVIEADAVHTVHFSLRLDVSQLPRPFQIGTVGRVGWSLLAASSQRLAAAEPAK